MIEKYLKVHKKSTPFDIFRNTLQMAEGWRRSIQWTRLDWIQKRCFNVIKRIGHRIFISQNEAKNKKISLRN